MSSSSLLSVTSLAVDPGTPPTLYAGTSSVFKSTDGGGSWSRLDSGLPELRVNALAIDPLTPALIYAGTDAGVFVLEQRETGPPAADAGLDSAVEATVIFGLR